MNVLEFIFGSQDTRSEADESGLRLHLTNKLIHGNRTERFRIGHGKAKHQEQFLTWRSEQTNNLYGVATVSTSDSSIKKDTEDLYIELLKLTRGQFLHRVWHFVPEINKQCGNTLDRYMLFCSGRAEALCDSPGGLADHRLPPASAVGTQGETLAIVFVAGDQQISTIENPLQVPAYKYPERYGPRAPSFARAGVLNKNRLYVSGTASIRDSQSLHEGDADAQFETAMENIETVVNESRFDLREASSASARVYVKDAQSWREEFGAHPILQEVSNLSVIQADICRNELLIEVELRASRAPE